MMGVMGYDYVASCSGAAVFPARMTLSPHSQKSQELFIGAPSVVVLFITSNNSYYDELDWLVIDLSPGSLILACVGQLYH